MDHRRTITIALVIIAIVAAGIAFLLLRNPSPSPSNPDTGSENPFGGSGGNAGGGQPGLTVVQKDGTSVNVPDFTKTDQPPIAGPDTGYQVSGSNASSFQILYFPNQSYFLVSLFSEPLGQTRLAAEAALRSKLGLSDSQLCALNIEVHTDAETNETYSGRDLGLSFCPGATALPQ